MQKKHFNLLMKTSLYYLFNAFVFKLAMFNPQHSKFYIQMGQTSPLIPILQCHFKTITLSQFESSEIMHI